ncbi:MAG: hypothetical protein H7X77_05280 [Anaerolineae bacterium]|nr:hypothetical protein [Anaerolineae bacterium]
MPYCSLPGANASTVNTTLVRERAVNGAADPFGVVLWGVGISPYSMNSVENRDNFKLVNLVVNADGQGCWRTRW